MGADSSAILPSIWIFAEDKHRKIHPSPLLAMSRIQTKARQKDLLV